MKKILPFVFAILIYTNGFSQSREEATPTSESIEKLEVNTYTKHRIGLNIGGSSPLGEYSEIDQNSEGSGYAEGGLSIGLSYQYSFQENFALSLLYGSTANKFAAQAFVDQLSFEEPRLNWRVEAEPYGVGYFMIGVKGYLGDEIKGYINPMLGFGTMIAPQVDIIASDGTSSVSQRIRESDPAGSAILGVSFGIDFLVSELVSINIDGTYLSSEFEIDQEFETFDSNGNPMVLYDTFNQPYSVLNFSLGIGFHF